MPARQTEKSVLLKFRNPPVKEKARDLYKEFGDPVKSILKFCVPAKVPLVLSGDILLLFQNFPFPEADAGQAFLFRRISIAEWLPFHRKNLGTAAYFVVQDLVCKFAKIISIRWKAKHNTSLIKLRTFL